MGGGRAIFSGDAVFLKAHTGMMLDVQSTAVQARWQDWGDWQKMFIQKLGGEGAIMPGDRIVLQAHTGKMLDVQGDVVAANWNDSGDWQTCSKSWVIWEPAEGYLLHQVPRSWKA